MLGDHFLRMASGDDAIASGQTRTMDTNRSKRVLVVEDDALVGMALEEMLLDLGYEVAGNAATLKAGLALAQSADVAFAVLDVDLHGIPSLEVADALKARGIPFLLSSGYGNGALEGAHSEAPRLGKPFLPTDLERAIGKLGID